MLSSAEHELLNSVMYKNIRKSDFLGSIKPRILCFLLIPTFVGFLTFMSRKNFMQAELSIKKIITSGPSFLKLNISKCDKIP